MYLNISSLLFFTLKFKTIIEKKKEILRESMAWKCLFSCASLFDMPLNIVNFLFHTLFSMVLGSLKFRWHKWLKFLVTVKDGSDEEAAGILSDSCCVCRWILWSHGSRWNWSEQSSQGPCFILLCLHIGVREPPIRLQWACLISCRFFYRKNSLWMAHQKNKNVDSLRKTWHAGKSFSSEMDPDLHLILNILTRPTSFDITSFPFH